MQASLLQLNVFGEGVGVAENVQRVPLIVVLKLYTISQHPPAAPRNDDVLPQENEIDMCSWTFSPTPGSSTLTGTPIFSRTSLRPIPESSRI